MAGAQPGDQLLLVEGDDDQHVVWQLCERHRLREVFQVLKPGDTVGYPLAPARALTSRGGPRVRGGGIDDLLKDISARVKQPGLRTLGILIDADEDVQARWDAVWDRLDAAGYRDIPRHPQVGGWITAQAGLPQIGVWIMPDNQGVGMLETFVAGLIEPTDALLVKANSVLDEIESQGISRYRPAHRPKALIHTWLAWQDPPGQPMGLGIKAQASLHRPDTAPAFVGWLRRLFGC